VCGELAALAQDVVLLSATEIGELRVATPGGSSALPHKQNPAAAVLAVACAHQVPGLVATVLAAMPQELQRSAGRWQSEWGTLSQLLRLAAATARHARECVQGLLVDTAAMLVHVEQLAARTGSADPGSAPAFVDRALAAYDPARPAGAR
jgi:3-carboxy-cis,cis-muconate cycloisomerase